ncbi:hypothetical protein AB1Y20_020815 [Prymnesium parvum]|uniref:Uncharacterized protein n=1 Tax=Prymnesium parvum TaxID=97485 RepID=A0AB34JVP8_PRYPA
MKPPSRDSMAPPPPPRFTLTEDELLAHVLFLQSAARLPDLADAPPPSSPPLSYHFDVEGTGGFLVTLLPAEARVHVSPYADVPDELRPRDLAATVRCSPLQMLTMLAGGAADLRLASPADLPSLQLFLRAFDFSGYPAFCEARHLRPYEPPARRRDADEIGETLRKSMDTVGTAVASGVRSVSQKLQAARASRASEGARLTHADEAEGGGEEAGGGGKGGKPLPFGEWREQVQSRAAGALSSAKKGINLAGARLSSAGERLGERVAEARRSRGGEARGGGGGGGGGGGAGGEAAEATSLREDQLSELVDPLWQNVLTKVLITDAEAGAEAPSAASAPADEQPPAAAGTVLAAEVGVEGSEGAETL